MSRATAGPFVGGGLDAAEALNSMVDVMQVDRVNVSYKTTVTTTYQGEPYQITGEEWYYGHPDTIFKETIRKTFKNGILIQVDTSNGVIAPRPPHYPR